MQKKDFLKMIEENNIDIFSFLISNNIPSQDFLNMDDMQVVDSTIIQSFYNLANIIDNEEGVFLDYMAANKIKIDEYTPIISLDSPSNIELNISISMLNKINFERSSL